MHIIYKELLCNEVNRCNSAACPICRFYFTNWLTSASAAILPKSHQALTDITLTIDSLPMFSGMMELLPVEDYVGRIKRRVSRHLMQCAATDVAAIGGMYFVWTEISHLCYKGGFWQPYLRLIVCGSDVDKLVNRLWRYYRPSWRTKEPIIAKGVSDISSVICQFTKLLQDHEHRRYSGKLAEDETTLDITRTAMKEKQLKELIRFLDGYYATQMLFLYNVKRVGKTLQMASYNQT